METGIEVAILQGPNLQSGKEILRTSLVAIPRVGDRIWVTGAGASSAKGPVEVKDVCYVVGPDTGEGGLTGVNILI